MLPRACACAIALSAIALLPSVARAQLVDAETDTVRRHFQRGAALYEEGRFADAIVEFQAARDIQARPEFEYNIARCHDRLDHWEQAIEGYERYLRTWPAEADAGEVLRRLEILRSRLPPRETAPKPAVAIEAAPAPPPRIDHRFPVVLPAVVGAVGAVTVIAGGTLYGVSGARYDDLVAGGCGRAVACGEDRVGSTRLIEQAGIGLLVAGGVVLVADVVLWATWKRRHPAGSR